MRNDDQLWEARGKRFKSFKVHHIPEDYQYRVMALIRDYAIDVNTATSVLLLAKFELEDLINKNAPADEIEAAQEKYNNCENEWREILNETTGLSHEDFMKEALNPIFDNPKTCAFCNSKIKPHKGLK